MGMDARGCAARVDCRHWSACPVRVGSARRATRARGRCCGFDRRHKFVRCYVVSDASVHDSQKFEDVLDTSNTASDVWADSAYRSQDIEEKLAERGLKSRIHRRAYRNRKLSEAQKAAITMRSKVRARVEHVFGDQKERHGSRARAHHRHRPRAVQDRNLVYNMRRFVCL
jgi:IS5 family transposase